MSEVFDGLLSFFSSHYAIRANTVLKRVGVKSELIPGPKELSPNCGVALRIEYERREEVMRILSEKKVQIDDVHFYHPRAENWNKG
jgi:hypothetical protein